MRELPWFKVYYEIISDPKIYRLTPTQKWLWVVLMCLASQNEKRGQVSLLTDEVGYTAEELTRLCGGGDQKEIEDGLKLMERLKMVEIAGDIITLVNFEDRQGKLLSEGERALKYRDKKKVTTVTQKSDDRHAGSRDGKLEIVTLDIEEDIDKEEEEDNTPLPPKGELVGFEIFWKAYPRRAAKGRAEKAWKNIMPNEQLLSQILAAIERAKTSDQWAKDEGRFIPHPATWLNAKGWEDEWGENANTMRTKSKYDDPSLYG